VFDEAEAIIRISNGTHTEIIVIKKIARTAEAARSTLDWIKYLYKYQESIQ
jgi:hypothetical protein